MRIIFFKWYPMNGQNSFLINSVERKCWVLSCGLICINRKKTCNVFFCRSLQHKAFATQPVAPPPVSNQAEDNSKAILGLILFLDDIIVSHNLCLNWTDISYLLSEHGLLYVTFCSRLTAADCSD